MQKKNLKTMALAGIAAGICLTQAQAAAATKTESPSYINEEAGNLDYHLMTEDELLLELDPEGTKVYKSLDDEGKRLARLVASQRCNELNECKGLNACRTEHNDCAGKGNCKGQSKCAFSDKNMAVKVVAEKMAKKRQEAANPSK